MHTVRSIERRDFLRIGSAATMTLLGSAFIPHKGFSHPAADDKINIIGPKQGYTPQVGTLVSMMTWMRTAVLYPVKGLSVADLDYLLDDKANTIGMLLYHLAATNAFYHEHTINNKEWGKWDESIDRQFGVAMEMGDEGRKQIKGHPLDFYLDLLETTRTKTFDALKKKDDAWLLTVDDKWPWGPTNNYCKWFHVCEHESHHTGQIAFLKNRLPSQTSNR